MRSEGYESRGGECANGAAGCTGRPTLDAWLNEYAEIEREYRDSLAACGVRFAPYGSHTRRVNLLKNRLKDKGARFLNGGSSISWGFISDACKACVGGTGSKTFYINLKCPHACYYCFNPNQEHYAYFCRHDTPWREDLEDFAAQCNRVSHIALTGGEPLLSKEKTVDFFHTAGGLYPDAHMRLYTSGFGFDEECAAMLAAEGLQEIRFSIKIEDGEEAVEDALRYIDIAKRHIPDVMVEMPAIPGNLEAMKDLLFALSEHGVRGINLLEFCFPLFNWPEFEKRGFSVKNPPFEVLYDYGYAGGLPVAGSEEECLELLLFAIESELPLGVHYCSLANKNIDQVLQANKSVVIDERIYRIDSDGLIKTAKAFDGDVDVAIRCLEGIGAAYKKENDGCIAFHPEHRALVEGAGVVAAVSCNVVENRGGVPVLRELKLSLGS